jgi:hypothetical protein
MFAVRRVSRAEVYERQTAGFEEASRRMAMTGEDFAADRAGLGLGILIVKLLRCC